MTLKQKVRSCLERHEKTRNSDTALIVRLWLDFYPDALSAMFAHVQAYSKENLSTSSLYEQTIGLFHFLEEVPSPAGIVRLRADIQNKDGEFPPTDDAVKLMRRQSENNWRQDLGYPMN